MPFVLIHPTQLSYSLHLLLLLPHMLVGLPSPSPLFSSSFSLSPPPSARVVLYWVLAFSNCLITKKFASKKRSTQFLAHDSSFLSNPLFLIAPVMHFVQQISVRECTATLALASIHHSKRLVEWFLAPCTLAPRHKSPTRAYPAPLSKTGGSYKAEIGKQIHTLLDLALLRLILNELLQLALIGVRQTGNIKFSLGIHIVYLYVLGVCLWGWV